VTADSPSALPIRLVVGLGNPGVRYRRTRHNAGQLVVEELARRFDAGSGRERYNARYWETRGPGGPVALLVPETYMNHSGDAVGPAYGSLKLEPAQVVIVHDEAALPFGTVRGKAGGGLAGHNGLKSVSAGLGSPDFLRIRLGVSEPPPEYRGNLADWLLGVFTEPAAEVEAMIGRGADMVELALEQGIDAAIARFHARPPGARRAARTASGESEE
jgi:PTH1 family peptidyl-tRNA hydrolase